MSVYTRLPAPGWLALTVWQRNFRVWRRLLGPSLAINFAEPLLYLLGLGYGLGLYIGQIEGLPYLTYLASGIMASAVMNVASYEALFSVYTRMVPQRTYAAMLTTPLGVDDIVAGELLWCATKGTINAAAILVVAAALGAVAGMQALWLLPLSLLMGISFAGLAMVVTSFARSYDFFSYYLTGVLAPMFLFSGVFFPLETLPTWLRQIMLCLPLAHGVALVRPLVAGVAPTDVFLHLAVLGVYAVGGYYACVVMIRRRLLV